MMMIGVIDVIGAVIVMMAGCLRLIMVLDERKAAHGNPAAQALAQSRVPAVCGQYCRQIGKYAVVQVRQCVEQRGDKHVAGQPADCVQMDVAEL
jgi:hypothetical protein